MVQELAGEILGEVAEDEGGPVRVRDSLAWRPVELLVQYAAADLVGTRAVEILQLGPQWNAGRMRQQLPGSYGTERMAGDLAPETHRDGDHPARVPLFGRFCPQIGLDKKQTPGH
ncbi:hypothetical protein HEP81_03718 [Streptomyces griseofuscus]|uniref:Uncharacterized protein n=1 Tax=Streptomyces griseofuscus TaxID=146922 RepID=A0A7H1Q136_9ACTN|nr:hypothetical protein HEP81_03718 [Streptomyces griseofuscus]BBC94680.1 hypothetical protein SRO_3504 [Streptomyces rochei]